MLRYMRLQPAVFMKSPLNRCKYHGHGLGDKRGEQYQVPCIDEFDRAPSATSKKPSRVTMEEARRYVFGTGKEEKQ